MSPPPLDHSKTIRRWIKKHARDISRIGFFDALGTAITNVQSINVHHRYQFVNGDELLATEQLEDEIEELNGILLAIKGKINLDGTMFTAFAVFRTKRILYICMGIGITANKAERISLSGLKHVITNDYTCASEDMQCIIDSVKRLGPSSFNTLMHKINSNFRKMQLREEIDEAEPASSADEELTHNPYEWVRHA